MSIDVILIAFLAVPVALTVVAASAVLIAGRAAPDAPAGYPGLRRLRRVAGATRLLAIVLGVAAFFVAGQFGALGRGWMLAPAVAGCTALACLVTGEMVTWRAAATPGVAALKIRSLRSYLPRRLAAGTLVGLALLVALLVIGAITASADDLGRPGRALAWTCGPDAAGAASPWPGSFYGVPLLVVLALGGGLAAGAYAISLRRPRNGSDPRIVAIDDALRGSTVASVTGVAALTVGTTLAGVAFVMAAVLGGATSGGTCPLSGPVTAAAPLAWAGIVGGLVLSTWGALGLARASRNLLSDAGPTRVLAGR